MRFTLNSYHDYYRLEANCYSIEIYQTPLTEDDFYNIVVEKLRYYCRKNRVSWLAVYSTTDSDTAEQTTVRTGKRGRPKKLVKGTKIDGHTHNIIVGTKQKSAYSTAQQIKKSLDKHYNKKICKVVSKGDSDHAYHHMKYCLKQADTKRTGGDFDFNQYLADHDFFS